MDLFAKFKALFVRQHTETVWHEWQLRHPDRDIGPADVYHRQRPMRRSRNRHTATGRGHR